jgi:hypothetical protein
MKKILIILGLIIAVFLYENKWQIDTSTLKRGILNAPKKIKTFIKTTRIVNVDSIEEKTNEIILPKNNRYVPQSSYTETLNRLSEIERSKLYTDKIPSASEIASFTLEDYLCMIEDNYGTDSLYHIFNIIENEGIEINKLNYLRSKIVFVYSNKIYVLTYAPLEEFQSVKYDDTYNTSKITKRQLYLYRRDGRGVWNKVSDMIRIDEKIFDCMGNEIQMKELNPRESSVKINDNIVTLNYYTTIWSNNHYRKQISIYNITIIND